MGRINYGASALFHSPTHVIDRGANDVWLGVRIRIFTQSPMKIQWSIS